MRPGNAGRSLHPARQPGLPLFFKLWVAFVAVAILAWVWVVGYAALAVVHAGPEGAGHAVGSFIHAIKEAS